MIFRRTTVLAAALAALIVIVGLAARALTPAGTSISAKATATYTNSTGAAMPGASSNTVSLTVGQIGGIQISLPGGSAQSFTTGQVGGVTVKVINAGNGNDSYALSSSSGNPKVSVQIVKDTNGDGIMQDAEAAGTVVSDTGTVAGGATANLFAKITPTADAVSGTSADITITAKSTFDSTKSAIATFQVVYGESKYIRTWLINGNYPNATKTAILTTDYLGGEAAVAPKDGDVTSGKTWKTYKATADKIDMLQLFPGATMCAAYAFTYVYSPTDVTALIKTGSDDGNAVWVNGVKVWSNNAFRAYLADQDSASITLKAGWNNLLVKISQGTGGWGFSARICDGSGNIIPGLIYSTVPPTAKDVTPPVVSNITVSAVGNDTATISWTTDENSSTDVLYGVASTSEKKYSDPTSVTQHKAVLASLTPGTKYVFKACSIDPSNNTATSNQLEFTTTAPPTANVEYLHDWLLNGYYLNSTKSTILTQDYLGMESLSAPKAGDVEGGKTWTIRKSTTDKVDLAAVFGAQSYAVAYACTYINSPVTVDALLKIGSDDGCKVWLNGNAVLTTSSIFRGYAVDQDVVPVTFNAGWNRILVKVCQKTGGWGFSVHVTNTAGGVLPGLTASVSTGDTIAPVISNLLVSSVTTTDATIEWDTDEPSTTELGYGVADIAENAYGDPTPVTHHVVNLANLQPSTTYKYKVYSADLQNNLATSDILTFDTISVPSTTTGYVTTWLVNGTYANADVTTRMTQSYLPDEANTYPYTGYTSNSLPWITPKTLSTGKVDLAATYNNPTNCAGYAHVYVYAPVEQIYNVLMGADDGLRVWYDGQFVWSKDVYRGLTPDEDKFQQYMTAGWHRLMVKISQGTGGWGFMLRFTDQAGNPVPGMKYQVDRPW